MIEHRVFGAAATVADAFSPGLAPIVERIIALAIVGAAGEDWLDRIEEVADGDAPGVDPALQPTSSKETPKQSQHLIISLSMHKLLVSSVPNLEQIAEIMNL